MVIYLRQQQQQQNGVDSAVDSQCRPGNSEMPRSPDRPTSLPVRRCRCLARPQPAPALREWWYYSAAATSALRRWRPFPPTLPVTSQDAVKQTAIANHACNALSAHSTTDDANTDTILTSLLHVKNFAFCHWLEVSLLQHWSLSPLQHWSHYRVTVWLTFSHRENTVELTEMKLLLKKSLRIQYIRGKTATPTRFVRK